jgi:hypothetical protein
MGVRSAIELYGNSDVYKKIVWHAWRLKGSKTEVKLYELVQ